MIPTELEQTITFLKRSGSRTDFLEELANRAEAAEAQVAEVRFAIRMMEDFLSPLPDDNIIKAAITNTIERIRVALKGKVPI